MFRKFLLIAGAAATLGAAAMAPTSASAWGWHGHHGWGWGHGYRVGFYGPRYVVGPDCYIVKRLVDTPYGLKVRRVTVCN